MMGRDFSKWDKNKIDSFDIDNRIAKFVRDNLNKMILSINKQNNENRRKARIALVLIMFGFSLQIGSLFA